MRCERCFVIISSNEFKEVAELGPFYSESCIQVNLCSVCARFIIYLREKGEEFLHRKDFDRFKNTIDSLTEDEIRALRIYFSEEDAE